MAVAKRATRGHSNQSDPQLRHSAGAVAATLLASWVVTDSADAAVIFTPTNTVIDGQFERAGVYFGPASDNDNLVAFAQNNPNDGKIELFNGNQADAPITPEPVVAYVALPVSNNVDNLAPGTEVGPLTPPLNAGVSGFRTLSGATGEILFDNGNIAEWPADGTSGYGGLRVTKDGNVHYGFFEFAVTQANPTAGVLRGYAFESVPGVGITVPEPTGLALLAAGASGLALFRGRRKA